MAGTAVADIIFQSETEFYSPIFETSKVYSNAFVIVTNEYIPVKGTQNHYPVQEFINKVRADSRIALGDDLQGSSIFFIFIWKLHLEKQAQGESDFPLLNQLFPAVFLVSLNFFDGPVVVA